LGYRTSLSFSFFFVIVLPPPRSPPFPTRRSSDLALRDVVVVPRLRRRPPVRVAHGRGVHDLRGDRRRRRRLLGRRRRRRPLRARSEEHTSELQSREHLVCRLLLGKKKNPPARSPL